ncbi:MAG: CopG family antitoxin, partial [Pyrinomonadaceae bacterium]
MKRKLPKFSSDEEFAEWVETHDLSDYLDSFEVVTEDMKVQRTSQKESIGVDLDARDVKAIKRVAKS